MPTTPGKGHIPSTPGNGHIPSTPRNGHIPSTPRNGHIPSTPGNGQLPSTPITRTRTKKRPKRRTSNSFKARKRPSDEALGVEAVDGTAPAADEHMTERCAVHPGSRNEQWCSDCQLAICVHCACSHPAHIVTTLSAAYDDTYEALDAMQLTLVEYLGETRQRKAQLDVQAADISRAHARAQDELDTRERACADALESRFDELQQTVQQCVDACGEWRAALEDTLRMVLQMVEELPPADLVARRERVLALLDAVDSSRPHDWLELVRADELSELVRPEWRFARVHVPRVMELGRRRGHVRVLGDPFPAHGMVWQAEARRSRGALGDPCLAVTVSCLEGCKTSAFSVGVHLAAQPLPDSEWPTGDSAEDRRFTQESHSHEWFAQSRYEFSVCSLSELDDAGVLDDEGGVVIRLGVRPESFTSLAWVQQDRIRCLEQRVKELEQQNASAATSDDSGKALRRRGSSVTQDRIVSSSAMQDRVASGSVTQGRTFSSNFTQDQQDTPLSRFTFATDSLSKARDAASPSMLASPLAGRQSGDQPAASALRRRANSSLALGEQRQQQKHQQLQASPPAPFPSNTAQASPPAPFPANNAQVFENAQACGSQSSVTSSQSSTSNMLRRLSGWVRSTEDRVVHQARRVRNQLSTGAHQECDDLDDWTFLDRTLSPGFPRAETEPISLHLQLARAQSSPVELQRPPPARPLPPLPDALERGRDSEDGFAFDGMADIEREQAKVDARMAARKQQQQQQDLSSSEKSSEIGLQARYESIVQRVNALQLIANTVENSRDGLTEGTLRRISSELGVLINGRRRHRASFARGLNTGSAAGRRTLSMDPNEARRAIARANVKVPLSVCISTVLSETDEKDDGLPPSRETSSEYERTMSPGLSPRRNSLGLGLSNNSSSSLTPVKTSTSPLLQQLTPQANRRGGILKPGRTQRSVPTRLLPEVTAPGTTDDLFGLINVRTPRGPGRFTEYVAESQSQSQSQSSSPANVSPESKSARSATLPPNANRVGVKPAETVTPTARETVSLGRPVRSARACRKRVRFPEEQRLLETIRLIDPRVAQSIECRAAKSAVAEAIEPVRMRSPPPAFNLHIHDNNNNNNAETEQSDEDDDDDSDGLPATSSLAARVRSSPRLAAKRLSIDASQSDAAVDEDDVFMDPDSSSSLSSPEQYDTANSQLFGSHDGLQRPSSISSGSTKPARRAPIPLQLQLTGRPSTIHGVQMEAAYRHSAAILDYSVMSPTFSAKSHSENSSASQSPRMSKQQQQLHDADAVTSSMRGLNISLREVPKWRANINSLGLAVGPNVGSPPSSPSLHNMGSNNCSSSPSPTRDLNLVCGSTDSAHLYPPNVAVFGGETK